MKFLWTEVYRVCACTMTERTRDLLPGFCPEHDHPKWIRSKIVEPVGFKDSSLGLRHAQETESLTLCQHQTNALACPFCEVLERKP